MAPVLLADFSLRGVDMDGFLHEFWLERAWYEGFLRDKLDDLDISVGDWAASNNKSDVFVRDVKSCHPSKISFPGLPSYTESLKAQTYEVTKDDEEEICVIINETNTFRGIPYSDYFSVKIRISIWLDFDFFKYTWLQGTIESNTHAELLGVYEMWQSAAEEHIKLLGQGGGDVVLSLDFAGEEGGGPAGAEAESRAESRAGTPRERSCSSAPQPGGGAALSREEDEGDGNLEYYDCVDGDAEGTSLLPRASLSRSSSFTRASRGLPLSSSGQHASSLGLGVGPDGPRSTRDVVVTVVETVFVVAEASFWRVHGFYRTDVKELFNVAPETVLARIAYSFRPGAHSSLLAAPDFYGPLLAVLLLPQVLLLSIDVTKHGCSQSSMLGNAVVVSLSLWVGLSVLYRLLALVIAPSIHLKHCLSVSGYSFFAWSLALLCSYPVEKHKSVLAIPLALPLVLFGLPAALAQGWVFWEHAPFASLTMQQAMIPSSVQHFAQQHSRLLQKILWSVPKVAALIVVAGTHYQLLWYLARVFLPGRKTMCDLSALMDRRQYTSILSQKELQVFALKLLKGGEE